jgi:hypothetical protein
VVSDTLFSCQCPFKGQCQRRNQIKGTLTPKKGCLSDTLFSCQCPFKGQRQRRNQIKGTLTPKKVCQLSIWRDVWKLRFLKCSIFRCKNLFTCGHRPQNNLIHGAGLKFLICPRLIVCGLLPGENILANGLHGDSIRSPPVCSPTGEAVKKVQTGFSWWSAVCHRSFLLICGLLLLSIVGGKDKISIHTV